MRFRSTPESAENLEPTWLAIIETIASIGIYLWIGLEWGFQIWAWAVLTAPWMLFRSKCSIEWGLKLHALLHDLAEDMTERNELYIDIETDSKLRTIRKGVPISIFIVTALLAITASLFVIRLVTTIVCMLKRPYLVIQGAPRNWIRQTICTDTYRPPEIIPGEISSKHSILRDAISSLKMLPKRDRFVEVWATALLLPAIIGYIPPLIYRVSFKATAIIYAPFIWVAHSATDEKLTLVKRLKQYTEGAREKLRRKFSMAVLGVLAAKLGVVYGLVEVDTLLKKVGGSKKALEMLGAKDWQWWQATLAIEVALTFVILYFCDAAIPRIDDERPAWKESIVSSSLSSLVFVRGALAIVTMSAGFFAALKFLHPELVASLVTRFW